LSRGAAADPSRNPLAAYGGVSPFSRGRIGTLPLVEGETPP